MVKNVLVMTDHFMRYALAVVTKDQMAKTVAKVFYECFIAIFGAPTKLLSDSGANFMSALVEELCSAFGIQKDHIDGEDDSINDDPRVGPEGGARPPCMSLRHQPEGS